MNKRSRCAALGLALIIIFSGIYPVRAEKFSAVMPEVRKESAFCARKERKEENAVSVMTMASEAEKILAVDEKHIYPGMEKSWQDGYTPSWKQNQVHLVLPLICKGEEAPDQKQVMASLEFPETSAGVFLGTNVQKKISEQTIRVNQEDCRVYLFDMEIEQKEGSAAGTYPVTVKVEYKYAGQEKSQNFTVYITIPDRPAGDPKEDETKNPTLPSQDSSENPSSSKDPSSVLPGSKEESASDPSASSDPASQDPSDDPLLPSDDLSSDDPLVSGDDISGSGDFGGGSGGGDGAAAETKPDAAPRILVETCEISPQEYRAGDHVEMRLVLRNTSKKKTLRNIRLTYTGNTDEVLPSETAPDLYIERLGAAGSIEEVLKLTILESASAVSQPVTLSMDYEDTDGNSYTSTEVIYLTLTTETDLRLDSPVVPASMEAMTGQEITMNLFNVGSAKVKNVVCSIEMEGIVPKGGVFVGNVEAGETKQAVISITVGDLTYNRPEQKEKYGTAKGTITVTYEDEKGNTYTQSVNLSSEIVKPEGAADETEEVKYESQWWVSIVIGLLLIQVMTGIIIFEKRRHRE